MVRAAYSLTKFWEQLNAIAPDRPRGSDGGIGNKEHAARQSDHNPDKFGIYHAIDITNFGIFGGDIHSLAVALVSDPRATYVISNGLFYDKVNGKVRVRDYRKVNPSATNMHVKHLHLSVKTGSIGDDRSPWLALTHANKEDIMATLSQEEANFILAALRDIGPLVAEVRNKLNDFDVYEKANDADNRALITETRDVLNNFVAATKGGQ